MIRNAGEVAEWNKLIWFKGRIPKTAFCLWLAAKGRLYTHDRIHNADPSWNCFLCNSHREDHRHLFFECSVSEQIWRRVQRVGGFSLPRLNWKDLISRLSKDWISSNLATISWKLCLAVTVYNVWAERNSRLHGQEHNDVVQITWKIVDLVKLKLSSLKSLKETAQNRDVARRWNLPNSIFEP